MSPTSVSQFDSPRGWFVVAGAFLGAVVVFGVSYTFGVFLKPMAADLHVGHATMSVLFSIVTALTFFLAPFTGELSDIYGPRPVVALGALLMTTGLLLTARAQSFALIAVTYGVGVGCASACIYIPGISAVGEWFRVRRNLALGVAVSGIGCGTLLAAPLSATLINRYGWRESFVFFGVAGGALLLIAAAFMARPPACAEKVEFSILHKCCTKSFAYLYVSLLFSGVAIYIAFVFVPVYAAGIGISRVHAAAVIGYIGAASVIGRLGLSTLAPRFGLVTVYQGSFAILMASYALWLVAHTYGALSIFAVVMGVGYGGIAAMAPGVAAELFGVEGLGELLGILLTGFGTACLVGPPLAGVLADYTHDYRWPVFLAFGATVLAFALVLPLRWQRVQSCEERARATEAA